jgi:hypothetical protein
MEHKSSKDVLRIKLPRNKDEMIDLSTMIHYAYPPIDGIKFQDEYIDKLVAKCYKGVFNSEIFGKDEVATTATGKNIDLQNAHDPMSDYANKLADYWMKTVLMVGVILDFADTIAIEKYPKDFKLKTAAELIADLEMLNKSGAPPFIATEVSRDIAMQLYMDRPLELLKFDVKQKLAPFIGKTESQIGIIMATDFVLKKDKVMFNYFEQFMEELEEESLRDKNDWQDMLEPDTFTQLQTAQKNGRVWFYDLPYNIQKELLEAKAQAKEQEINDETPAAIPFGAAPNPQA